jgi:hypothetical protein
MNPRSVFGFVGNGQDVVMLVGVHAVFCRRTIGVLQFGFAARTPNIPAVALREKPETLRMATKIFLGGSFSTGRLNTHLKAHKTIVRDAPQTQRNPSLSTPLSVSERVSVVLGLCKSLKYSGLKVPVRVYRTISLQPPVAQCYLTDMCL